VSGLITKAIRDYDMIRSGDRILVGASGGKDSTALVYDLEQKRKHDLFRFEFEALHIEGDFAPEGARENLESMFASWGVPLRTVEVSAIGRLKPGRRMNCYWCSTQRRTELIRYAMTNGFNKIALGHHLDDIVETLFMNMLAKGEFSTMPPVMKYRKYPVVIIRPLALTEERQIIEFTKALGIDGSVCTCEFGDNSERKKIRARIAEFTRNSSRAKRNIFKSMSRIDREYLA